MSDLIDRQELLKHKGNCYDEEGHLLYAVGTGTILLMPTVDAVEVVRCKDCKFASLTYDGECKYCQKWEEKHDGESVSLYLDGDFYCAFGERKEDEAD